MLFMKTTFNKKLSKFLLVLILFLPITIFSQSKYSISGKIKNCKGGKIVLSLVACKETIGVDSLNLTNNCTFKFNFPDSNYVGLYKISFNKNPFEIVFKKENIVIEFNADSLNDIHILKSEENKIYYSYLKNATVLGDSIEYLTLIGNNLYKLDPEKNKTDLKQLAKQISDIEKRKAKNADSILTKHSSLFASEVIKASLTPDYKAYKKQKNAADYPNEAEFLREHFFDNINFADSNLLHTEVIFDKIGEYLQYYASSPTIETYKKAIDFILVRTSENKNINDYVMNIMLKTFDHSSWDEVYAYVADKYISQNSCTDDYRIKKISAKSNSIKALRIGNKSPEIKSMNLDGKTMILDSLKSTYTLVMFWSSWCDYCEAAMPDVKNIYAKYKQKGLDIFAVSLDSIKENWMLATNKHAITWVNTSDLKGYKSENVFNYNIWSTPTFLLLDSDKKIIARPANTAILKEELEKLKWNN